MDTKIDFKDPAYYENRELSWIKFDQRVLSEASGKRKGIEKQYERKRKTA